MSDICFILGSYPGYGGVETVTTVLANAFVNGGHRVIICSFRQPNPELASQLDDRVRFYPLSDPAYSAENIKTLRQLIIKHNINTVINQWVVPYYVTRLIRKASRGTSCRLLNVHHNQPDTNARIKGCEIELSMGGNIMRRTVTRLKLAAIRAVSRYNLRMAYKHCDKYIVLSPSFIPLLARYIGISDPSHAVAVPNPLTINCDYSNDELYSAKRNEVVYVGRIEDNQKRTRRLIDTWLRFHPTHPDWRLRIVGDGPDADSLRKYIADTGAKNVSIEGFQNPAKYYLHAKVMIMTSEYEGFPLVLNEAMHFGVVPVVYGSYPAVYDIINNGINGYILPPSFDADKFAVLLTHAVAGYSRTTVDTQVSTSQNFSLTSLTSTWNSILNNG